MILGAEVSATEIWSFLIGGLTFGAAAIGIYDKRKRELTETYKQLYEAKSDKVEELEREVRGLKAQVDLLMSDFTAKLAVGITDALHRIYLEKEASHGRSADPS